MSQQNNAIRITVDNSTGGKAPDIYRATPSQYDSCIHMDTSRRGRVRSHRDVQDATPSGSLVTDTLALCQISEGPLLALGTAPSTNYGRIIQRTTPTASWTQPSNNTTSSGHATGEMFFEHQGYQYFWTGNGIISRWKKDGSAMDTAWFNTSNSSDTNSVGYSWVQNGYAYFAQGNKLYGIRFNTDTPVVQFTVPDEYTIVTLEQWDNYLAIGCVHNSKFNNSKVFFFDGISPKATFVKVIPDGKLVMIRNINGQLAAISLYALNAENQASALITQETILMASTYNGGEFSNNVLLTLSYDDIVAIIYESSGIVKNNFLYFALSSNDTNVYTGVYRFGIYENEYLLTEDRFVTNNSLTTQPNQIKDIEFMGDVLFSTFDSHTSVPIVTKTHQNRDYSAAQKILTSARFVIGKNVDNKKIKTIWVSTIPLLNEPPYASTQTVAIYQRIDNEESWTYVATHNAALGSSSSFTNQNTDNLCPPRCSNIQFQFVVTGLVQIVDYGFEYENLPTDLRTD